ncbi:MAG: hypothetical protein QF441_04830 [Bacteriovoracaceae bacterium]|jgi:3-hydroxyacyl-[acyl-carrier-protein] dehydratase|nr:beta-hydroxyacyl-ACP dehydratase [Halobacteriovoraceae bacterium]MDP7319907.1 hypothetical protein [Bacteriovoracaceae bacterium]|tara:strand:+ start:458 stop:880 length:423 start_codon:yes stop_codon:yes gene_type:complete
MDIKDLIPQRDPFLFIDNVESLSEKEIIVSTTFTAELDVFKGHFPGNPIVPGVLLTEHCFQSGAALISGHSKTGFQDKLAVVSRIQSAKFKHIVKPDELITTKTTLLEQIDNAAFFKSITTNSEKKKVLILEFACNLVSG